MNGFKKHQPVTEADYVFVATVSGSVAHDIGDLMELTTGNTTWAKCTSSTDYFTLKAIVLDTNATAGTTVRCMLVRPYEPYEVDCTNNSAATDNGDFMILTDEATVNNSHTDVTDQTCCVRQINVVGAATDKRIIVLIPTVGIDPDVA